MVSIKTSLNYWRAVEQNKGFLIFLHQIKSNQIKSNQIKSNQIKSNLEQLKDPKVVPLMSHQGIEASPQTLVLSDIFEI